MFAIALLANALAAPITLDVDASKARQYLLQVEEHIPVSGRTAQLTLPKWIPGEHQPSGTINHVFGFHAYVKGKEIPWRRDPIELFTINVDLPDGTDELQIKFKVASSPGDNLTAHLGRIKWNRLVFLPAGRIDSIPVKASLTAPAGWVIQSAMHGYPKGDRRDFETVSAEKLVDSPAQIGEFGKSFEVASGYWFDVLVDDPKQLELRPEILTAFKNLVVQSQALTGAKHFKEYHWLSTFSSQGASEGLEHHECSEDGESPDALKPENGYTLGELMCHEMFHSWNGKYRRPAGLVTKTFTEPQQTELLWVYEGLTQYYGVVLACRAGFITPETTRDHIADTIYNLITPGRKWRPLADTAVAASILRSGSSWLDRRSQSYYNEGLAVWLEADAIIRSKTRSQKSLDDFVRRFHGGKDSGGEVSTYTYKDVMDGLDAVCHYDWDGFFKKRFYALAPDPPVDGSAAAGWKFVLSDKLNSVTTVTEGRNGVFRPEFGLSLNRSGGVTAVATDSPAFAAGISLGATITAVNDKPFSIEAFNEALTAAKTSPLKVTFTMAGLTTTATIDYKGGIQRPNLERIEGTPDYLTEILRPLAVK